MIYYDWHFIYSLKIISITPLQVWPGYTQTTDVIYIVQTK